MNNSNLPGRLGNPELTVTKDPRIDPRVAALLEMGEGLPEIEPPVNATYEESLAFCNEFEAQDAAMHAAQLEMMPDFGHIEQRTETIEGPDGNDLTLYIHRPRGSEDNLPCLVHTHGGGMVLMTAADPGCIRWRNSLAEAGIVVVGIEFRNGGGRLGNHPFPAGLNDCAAGVRWVYANREALGITGLVVSGESGGGNLSIATTLKALKEGWVNEIDGVYAQCPYISGAYDDPLAEASLGHLLLERLAVLGVVHQVLNRRLLLILISLGELIFIQVGWRVLPHLVLKRPPILGVVHEILDGRLAVVVSLVILREVEVVPLPCLSFT